VNARQRSNAAGAAQRRRETRAWVVLGVTVLLVLTAWGTWLWAAGW
jgi:hypothetical protein